MLVYILSCHGRICLGLTSAKASHAILVSYHALAVSAEAWHATLYLVKPWQYLPRLGMLFQYLITPWQYLPRLGILVYILSRLGSIC